MTKTRNIRLYRACQRCRQRKLKCDPTLLPDGTYSPCFECMRASEKCVASPASRRGGDFSHFRRMKTSKERGSSGRAPSPQASTHRESSTQQQETHQVSADDPIYAELTNPGEALQILARLAEKDSQRQNWQAGQTSTTLDAREAADTVLGNPPQTRDGSKSTTLRGAASDVEILVIDQLGVETGKTLLKHYAENYHPFSPLAPKWLLAADAILNTANNEPFLLTVVLTIASKDDPGSREIHQSCWQCLKKCLLDILLATPSTLNVGTVEGLLLLAEWVPYLQLETSSYPEMFPRNLSAVEDNMAWSLIGQAIRHSYLLRLDKGSFKEKTHGEPEETENRRRLAWIFVYISDRQISVRMGQSFWSRGPSLSTRFTADDFPSLGLSDGAENNYASVLHATIELTQLLHNTHDILYSSKERRMNMVQRGDYSRYLDDFRRSLSSWKSRWDKLQSTPKLHYTLRIFQEYIRLYVMAFSFQSILSRAVQENHPGVSTVPFSLFPDGITASADGAYVFEAIESARRILEIASENDPVAHMRYMPFRFYVYTIYSAVFLYKSTVFGAFSPTEQENIAGLVRKFIHTLEEAATSDCHIGARYAKLLNRIWFNDRDKSIEQSQLVHSRNFSNAPPVPEVSNHTIGGLFGDQGSEAIPNTLPDFDLFCLDFSSLEAELFGAESTSLGT